MKLSEGLYEQLIDTLFDKSINEAARDNLRAELRGLDQGDSHTYFAQYLDIKIRNAFASLSGANRLGQQLELANRIIALLAENEARGVDVGGNNLLRAELLLAIFKAPSQASPFERPDTPLSTSCLMTGTRLDPSLVSQLRK